MSQSTPVLVEVRNAVAWIRLNQPERYNALSEAMRQGLRDALDRIEGDPSIRVIVVTGSGPAFSAGGDLKEFRSLVESGQTRLIRTQVDDASRMLCRFEDSPRPVIAAVNGVAVAGGLELILCCDIVIAADTAKIGDGHLKYGVLPGGGGAVRLPRKLPSNVAKHLLLTGELVPAAEMARWGLVNQVVPAGQLESTVTALADRIARLSPLALAKVKQVANGACDHSVRDALRTEMDVFGDYVRSSDFLEGINAFAEKREPRFTGA